MQIKLIESIALSQMREALEGQKMSLKTAYKINKLISSAENNLTFYRNKLTELTQKYGEKEPDGKTPKMTEDGGILIKEESREECEKEIVELNQLEVDIENVEFSLSELENLEIDILTLQLLDPFIK